MSGQKNPTLITKDCFVHYMVEMEQTEGEKSKWWVLVKNEEYSPIRKYICC